MVTNFVLDIERQGDYLTLTPFPACPIPLKFM